MDHRHSRDSHSHSPQYYLEELANSLTHGLGAILSVAGLIALVAMAAARGKTPHLVGCTVFGVSLVLLYTASTLYHAFHGPDLKRILRIIDHSCIYVLIAGTYTPFAVTFLRGTAGWTLMAVLWGLTLFGIVFKIFTINRFEFLSTTIYLLMGWMAIFAIKPILHNIPTGGILLMAAGGLAYTLGVVFYAKDKNPFFHAVWHLFVMAGSAFHYLAVAYYVIPF